jgi:hypothetical protein
MKSAIQVLNDAFVPSTVTPAAQATIDAYADVDGSTLDALNYRTVSFTIVENNVNAIKWKVLASNDSAFAVSVVAQAEATVAKAASSSYSTTTAVWRYYKVQVCANVGSSQGNVTVVGLAKG